MPYNGAGLFAAPGASFPAVAGGLLESAKYNAVINDIASGLTNAITKDGQTTITSNLPMSGFRHTNVGDGVARTDYASYGQLIDSTGIFVTNYGATGDGVTDDSLAIQTAIDAVGASGTIHFPAGDYYIATPITLPSKNIVLRGEGRATRIFGAASSLITYSTTTGAVSQHIHDIAFEATADNICIKMHQTWDTAGKVPPRITGCYFQNSSLTTTTAKCISLMGVWSVHIEGCNFRGKGGGGSPTTGIGGYGIYIELGDDMNTSVMNVNVSDSEFLTLAYPVWCSDRTLTAGGRVEGISLNSCSFVAGYVAIRTFQTLALLINGCVISDYDTAIDLNDDFDFTITGNAEVDGSTVGIKLTATSAGLVERGVIAGNVIQATQGAISIQLNNDIGNGRMRVIAISNNVIGKPVVTETKTGIGIQFAGTFAIPGVSITGNVFEQLATGIDYAGVANTGHVITGNTYYSVDAEVDGTVGATVMLDSTGELTGISKIQVGNPDSLSQQVVPSAGVLLDVIQTAGITDLIKCVAPVSGYILNYAAGAVQVRLSPTTFLFNSSGAALELGAWSSPNTPRIDFHSSGNAIDYDSAILATGGTGVAGNGALSFFGGAFAFNNIVRPNADGTIDLGASSLQWKSGYFGTSLLIGGTKVIGARNTGWLAMTGTADESTALATSTATLEQLAQRVKALQDALATHGLIGT